jgi:type I restriction enzyme S subunit
MYRLRRRADSWLTSSYLYLLLNSREMHDIVSGYANGTTVNMLPIDGVQRPLMVCPPAGLVEVFNALAVESERSREEMVSESRTLIALRDTLLPKLVSGELRIPQSLLGGTRSGAFQR